MATWAEAGAAEIHRISFCCCPTKVFAIRGPIREKREVVRSERREVVLFGGWEIYKAHLSTLESKKCLPFNGTNSRIKETRRLIPGESSPFNHTFTSHQLMLVKETRNSLYAFYALWSRNLFMRFTHTQKKKNHGRESRVYAPCMYAPKRKEKKKCNQVSDNCVFHCSVSSFLKGLISWLLL